MTARTQLELQSNDSRFCCATKMLSERRRREPTKASRANSKRMLASDSEALTWLYLTAPHVLVHLLDKRSCRWVVLEQQAKCPDGAVRLLQELVLRAVQLLPVSSSY